MIGEKFITESMTNKLIGERFIIESTANKLIGERFITESTANKVIGVEISESKIKWSDWWRDLLLKVR